ncbi:MAG: hypothetical protein COA62_00940 [Rhodobiaceae bacterium]|nr:MAG: hypothetical protein COA62_00940 [Rhodobiaceae bacterium]
MQLVWGLVFPGLVMLSPIWVHIGIISEAINAVPNIWTPGFWGGVEYNLIEMIRNVGFIGLGLIGIWLAWRRVGSADSQAIAANETARAANETARFAELSHWSVRFNNAANNLASASAAERCAGIYTLSEIGGELGDEYLYNSVRMLEAFIRERREGEEFEGELSLPTDVEMALSQIRNLTADTHLGPVNLNKCNLKRMRLIGRWNNFNFDSADISHAQSQSARFYNCDFGQVSSAIHFNQAIFEWSKFTASKLISDGINPTFTMCEFLQCEFYLADFTDTVFEMPKIGMCTWNYCILSGAKFRVSSLKSLKPHSIIAMAAATWTDDNPPVFLSKDDGQKITLPDLVTKLKDAMKK